ncbi:MAG TPA: hypothetical protein VEI48_12490 [Candidatus Sulfotelmatobacter sp.]|nr:hypothetical protein [Candidatus Sulfotelmatobacter sp.]
MTMPSSPGPTGADPAAGARPPAQGWYWSFDGGREGLPWVGIFLVAFGVALLVGQLTTPLSAGALVLDALAATFLVTWLANGARGASLPALIFIALGAASTLADLGVITGSGWGTFFLGLAFAVAWLLGRAWGGGSGWTAWAAAVFLFVGGIQVAGRIPGVPDLSRLWPLLIVALGLWLVWRARGRPGWG